MSIADRLTASINKMQSVFADAVVTVKYAGDEFSALAKKTAGQTIAAEFSDSTDDLGHIVFKVSDCSSTVNRGDPIYIDGVDRLVKTAEKDGCALESSTLTLITTSRSVASILSL